VQPGTRFFDDALLATQEICLNPATCLERFAASDTLLTQVTNMKILIADKLSNKAVDALKALGTKVTVNPDLGRDDLPRAIGDANVLVVRSTEVLAATIENGKSLEMIIRAGAGVNTIDLEKASAMGVYVANCPGRNNDAVAELALGLMIAADRRIVDATGQLRGGKWNKKEFSRAGGLKGRTLGIVGMGAIGTSLAGRARAMEMDVICWSRSLTPARADAMGIGYCAQIGDLAAAADVVSVHLAATAETKQLFNDTFFARMKNGAIFVNTSRGDLVDTAALRKAIVEKHLKVGLDVFENEPAGGVADFDQAELAALVTATPHIGASTDQASEAIADEVVRIIESLIRTGKPINNVNARAKRSDGTMLVVRHFNRVGVLASVLDLLREAGINVEEMENTIFRGGAAAVACLKLDKRPDEELLHRISAHSDIIKAMLH
jgi:D-3-phosphoglycerate dehydrogenase